jgi:hypothetical protein
MEETPMLGGSDMLRKTFRTMVTFVLIALIGTVGWFVWKSKSQSSPLVCGSDQIKVVIKTERSLADILAEYQPNVAVGEVARLMKLEPTARLRANGNGEYCITVGKKFAKIAQADSGRSSRSSRSARSAGICAKLGPEQIRDLAYRAGWRGKDVNIAVAIAMAESSGKTCAVGDTALQTSVWGPSIGLFQIRSLKQQSGTGKVRDQQVNDDPETNVRHAYAIWRESGGWRPWSTWLHGTYKHRL